MMTLTKVTTNIARQSLQFLELTKRTLSEVTFAEQSQNTHLQLPPGQTLITNVQAATLHAHQTRTLRTQFVCQKVRLTNALSMTYHLFLRLNSTNLAQVVIVTGTNNSIMKTTRS